MADSPKRIIGANICFDCDRACGGCSWSALDPVTGKPQFKPVPGWTATPVVLNESHNGYEYKYATYQITACPQFKPTPERNVPPDYISAEPENPKNQKVCPICGKKFTARSKNNVYCCRACRYKGDLARKARHRAKMRTQTEQRKPNGNDIPVVCRDILTGSEMRWPAIAEAARAIKGSPGRISKACSAGKPYRGGIWHKEPKEKKDGGGKR